MNKIEYWKKYYKNHKKDIPSSFCKWCIKDFPYIFKDNTVIDMCCGNGRDSVLIGTIAKYVLGIDVSYQPQKSLNNVDYFVDSVKNCIIGPERYPLPDTIYCRFGFHAIEQTDQDLIIDWGAKYLAIEARSAVEKTPDETHYRRLIDLESLLESLESCHYNIEYVAESTGFAKTDKEDPVIIRVIANKRNY